LLVKRNVSLSPLIPFGSIRFASRKRIQRHLPDKYLVTYFPFCMTKREIKKVTTSEFRFTKSTCDDFKTIKQSVLFDCFQHNFYLKVTLCFLSNFLRQTFFVKIPFSVPLVILIFALGER